MTSGMSSGFDRDSERAGVEVGDIFGTQADTSKHCNLKNRLC